MLTVLFLLFQFNLVQSCNFDKGEFYYVLELGFTGVDYGQYCSDVGSSEVPREWCMDVLTDNGRLSNEYSIPPFPYFQYIYYSGQVSQSPEMYRLKYSREAAGHVTLMNRFATATPLNAMTSFDYCSVYNYSTGETSSCGSLPDYPSYPRATNSPMARPRGCSYNREGGQGEHGMTGNVIWRNATMNEGVADNPSPGGLNLNFGKCGTVKANDVAPYGWGIFYGEGYYTDPNDLNSFVYYHPPDGGQKPYDIIDTKDVCICNRPGEDVPKCISDCPLKDHPDPDKYYGRCHPGKNFDSCECEYCINGDAPYPYLNQCKREGCMDSTAMNYNTMANVDDGSCIPVKVGCMFSIFENYDPEANSNDMSLCGELVCSKISDLAVEKQCCAK